MLTSLALSLLTFMSLLFGGTGFQTQYIVGPGRIMRDFTTAGKTSKTDYFMVDLPVLYYATATGSTALQYKSICAPNPLVSLRKGTGSGSVANLNIGTGTILSAMWMGGDNPNGVGGDIGFSDSCDLASASGSQLIADICTSTGCVTDYVPHTSYVRWAPDKYLTLTLRDDPTSAFWGKLYVKLADSGQDRATSSSAASSQASSQAASSQASS